jgi:hypothetical protein
MPLRDFADDAGREWRVWDVRQENIHPATRDEEYMREYLHGWLAFESLDGTAKCRLHPIPPHWDAADDAQLVRWLHLAEPIRGDRSSGPQGRIAAETIAREKIVERPRGSARTFRFPSGRYWSVAEWTTTSGNTAATPVARAILRFTSGMRSLDLTEWPRDWQTLTDAQLASMLARGFPRPLRQENPTEFRRRAADHERR